MNDGTNVNQNVLNATIKNNVIDTPGTPSGRNAVRADVGFASTGEAGTLCLDLGDSTASLKNQVFAGGSEAVGGQDIRIVEDDDPGSNLLVKMPSLTGTTTSAFASYLIARNDKGGTPSAAVVGDPADFSASAGGMRAAVRTGEHG